MESPIGSRFCNDYDDSVFMPWELRLPSKRMMPSVVEDLSSFLCFAEYILLANATGSHESCYCNSNFRYNTGIWQYIKLLRWLIFFIHKLSSQKITKGPIFTCILSFEYTYVLFLWMRFSIYICYLTSRQ